jgi:hypothetical protein
MYPLGVDLFHAEGRMAWLETNNHFRSFSNAPKSLIVAEVLADMTQAP